MLFLLVTFYLPPIVPSVAPSESVNPPQATSTSKVDRKVWTDGGWGWMDRGNRWCFNGKVCQKRFFLLGVKLEVIFVASTLWEGIV